LLAAIAFSAVVLLTQEAASRRSRYPQLSAVATICSFEMLLGVLVAGTGGARSLLLPWLIVPTTMLAARFRAAVVAAGVLLCAGCAAFAIGLGTLLHRQSDVSTWVHIVAFAALLTSLTAATFAMLSGEMSSRGAAAVDPLTGLLTQPALTDRFEQVRAQAVVLAAPVGMILMDLDPFKAINDTYGHDAGARVLVDVAAA
jgi:GGDEF domain-containing protein